MLSPVNCIIVRLDYLFKLPSLDFFIIIYWIIYVSANSKAHFSFSLESYYWIVLA